MASSDPPVNPLQLDKALSTAVPALQIARVPFEIEVQSMTNWCWAACTVAICRHYNDPPITQGEVVAEVLNKPICARQKHPLCNKTVDFALPLGMVNHLKDKFDTYLSDQQLEIALQKFGPVGCQLDLKYGGHAVVIVDLSRSGGYVMLEVADPAHGNIKKMPYDQFRTNFDGSNGRWIRTYTTIA